MTLIFRCPMDGDRDECPGADERLRDLEFNLGSIELEQRVVPTAFDEGQSGTYVAQWTHFVLLQDLYALRSPAIFNLWADSAAGEAPAASAEDAKKALRKLRARLKEVVDRDRLKTKNEE